MGDVQIATDIISQLETGSTMPMQLETKFIDVGSAAEAKRLLPVVEQLYQQPGQRRRRRPGERTPRSWPTRIQGRLIVTASEEHLAEDRSAGQAAEAERQARVQTRRLQIITLKNVPRRRDVQEHHRPGDREDERPAFPGRCPSRLLVPDAGNNRLLVTATDEQFKEIEQVVAGARRDARRRQRARDDASSRVQSKPASELITLVTQLMAAAGRAAGQSAAARPSSSPTRRAGRSLRWRPPRTQERIKALVAAARHCDRRLRRARSSRAWICTAATRAEFTPLVQQLYQEQIEGSARARRRSPPPCWPTRGNNRIMVSGAEQEIARVEAIIRQLDPEGQERRQGGDARHPAQVRPGRGPGRRWSRRASTPSQHQVKVLVDARSNSLVVTGDSAVGRGRRRRSSPQLDTQSEVRPARDAHSRAQAGRRQHRPRCHGHQSVRRDDEGPARPRLCGRRPSWWPIARGEPPDRHRPEG
ncbi:MAG: hypothetical protein MZV64_71050 [Ignavibacteriales bacterium]|nr:hypothetical protein [Ignavibacteriales bacterium]